MIGDAVLRAAKVALTHEPVPASQVIAGEPATGIQELGTFGDTEIGVWEMTAGAMSDVEADEVFIVIAGRARVHFAGDRPDLDLQPGDVAQLHAGEHTVWTVGETLRKVYLA